MRDKYIEERFPPWAWDDNCGSPEDADMQDLAVRMLDESGDFPPIEALIAEHNRTVEALCDAVRRLTPEQQTEWLAAYPQWRPRPRKDDAR